MNAQETPDRWAVGKQPGHALPRGRASQRPAGRSETLVDAAVRRLTEHIRDNDLRVGAPLPGVGFFASEFGFSKTVIREAFLALGALKQIDVANGRTARVGAIDGTVMARSIDHAYATSQVSMVEIWDVRRTLEVRTAELAAQHRSEEQANQLQQLCEGIERDTADLEAVTRQDILFHQTIAKAGGNALFFQIVRSFEETMKVAVPLAWRTRETIEQHRAMLDHHRRIATAIVLRQPEEAAAAMAAHFVASIGDVLASTGDDLPM